MILRIVPLLLAAVLAASAQQKYSGPRPVKPDLPYLKHAQNLVPTESAMAKEEKKKDETLYIVDGAASTVKTPLASPILLIEIDKLNPDKLGLYKLETRNGRREIMFSQNPKKNPKPIRVTVNRIADKLYQIEVADSLENGEYSLSPEESNQVFCFQVY